MRAGRDAGRCGCRALRWLDALRTRIACIACSAGPVVAAPVPPPATRYVAGAAGQQHMCALDASGVPSCWGSNAFGQSTPLPGPYSLIASSANSTCGLRNDTGLLECFGRLAQRSAYTFQQMAAPGQPFSDASTFVSSASWAVGLDGGNDTDCASTRNCATLAGAVAAVSKPFARILVYNSTYSAPTRVPQDLYGLSIAGASPGARVVFKESALAAAGMASFIVADNVPGVTISGFTIASDAGTSRTPQQSPTCAVGLRLDGRFARVTAVSFEGVVCTSSIIQATAPTGAHATVGYDLQGSYTVELRGLTFVNSSTLDGDYMNVTAAKRLLVSSIAATHSGDAGWRSALLSLTDTQAAVDGIMATGFTGTAAHFGAFLRARLTVHTRCKQRLHVARDIACYAGAIVSAFTTLGLTVTLNNIVATSMRLVAPSVIALRINAAVTIQNVFINDVVAPFAAAEAVPGMVFVTTTGTSQTYSLTSISVTNVLVTQAVTYGGAVTINRGGSSTVTNLFVQNVTLVGGGSGGALWARSMCGSSGIAVTSPVVDNVTATTGAAFFFLTGPYTDGGNEVRITAATVSRTRATGDGELMRPCTRGRRA